MNDTEHDARTEYIAGLRAIADTLDTTDTLDVPFFGNVSPVLIFADTREELIVWAELLTERGAPEIRESEPHGFKLTGRIHGFAVVLYAALSVAGEPNGTRTVTTYALDPELAGATS